MKAHTRSKSGERRIRVTVTLSPRVVRLLDTATTKARSRSSVVEQCVLKAARELERDELRKRIDAWYADPDTDAGDQRGWHALADDALTRLAP